MEQQIVNILLILQLVSRAIAAAARERHAESQSTEEFTISIPLIHVVHDLIEKRLANASHLVHAQPDIVARLMQDIPLTESEMVRLLTL